MIDDISPPGSWVRELSARPHTYRDVWAALREAEARLAKVEAERDRCKAAWDAAHAQAMQNGAERDALRADAERYRWLRGGFEETRFGWRIDLGIRGAPSLESLDDCIDAARGGA